MEKEKFSSPKELIDSLGEEEVALIETLTKDGAKNVIGARGW